MNAGIEDFSVYAGRAAINVDRLASGRGLDVSRMKNLLMHEKTVALPFEDAVSFAVNAAKPIVERLGAERLERVEQLIVATESGVDFGKPISSYVHQWLGLPPRCRTYEVKHACYGGTAALQSALNFCHAGVSPGGKSLVITTDAARPIPHTYAEPSQGAAAVAMLVGEEPRVLEVEKGLSGCHGFEVMDSCRPTPETETGDADLSLLTYLECIENSFRAYQRKAPETRFASFDYLAFHTPFGGMAKGAHRTMMRKFERLPPAEVEADYRRRLEPSLHYCSRVGNIYSGTVFLALAGVLAQGSFAAPERRRVGLFSYGSGCCSEFYSGLADARAQQAVAALEIGAQLDDRHQLSVDEYDQLLSQQRSLRFGLKDVEPLGGEWQRLVEGRGILVLHGIRDYHREYRWA